MSDPPKRYESDLTVRIDRGLLPPTESYEAPPTLEACPACASCETCKGMHHVECPRCGSHVLPCDGPCSTCSVCLGEHMLSQAEAKAWRQANGPAEPPPEAA